MICPSRDDLVEVLLLHSSILYTLWEKRKKKILRQKVSPLKKTTTKKSELMLRKTKNVPGRANNERAPNQGGYSYRAYPLPTVPYQVYINNVLPWYLIIINCGTQETQPYATRRIRLAGGGQSTHRTKQNKNIIASCLPRLPSRVTCWDVSILKKSLNASKSSEHSPDKGGGGNVKTFGWDRSRLQRLNLFMAWDVSICFAYLFQLAVKVNIC